MNASEASARMWEDIAQTRVYVGITHGPTGWRLVAEKGPASTATGNANTAADVARLLRSLIPEVVAEIEATASGHPPPTVDRNADRAP